MFEKFTQGARAAVEDARYETGRRGDRRIGTEHLLLALLQDEALAQIVGVDIAAAQEAANQLDRAALASIGLTLGDFKPSRSTPLRRFVPLTSGAKTVIQQTVTYAAAEKSRVITTRHIMLAILDRHEPDPAATLLTALLVDRPKLRERLTSAA
jgi:ATP-dependent Clp protease ATP-binding subunit ClpA